MFASFIKVESEFNFNNTNKLSNGLVELTELFTLYVHSYIYIVKRLFLSREKIIITSNLREELQRRNLISSREKEM